jgi:hypothetical protein
MPFGMKNVKNTFSKTMIKVFGRYMDKLFKFFVDDLNIHIMTWEYQLNHFQFVLLKLREVHMKFNLIKCEFAKTNIGFISHVMNRDGMQLDQFIRRKHGFLN